MGVVYRARHVGSMKAAALKTVRPSAPQLLESLRREIHTLTRIRHPGIVRVLDHGVHEGRPWYAMDLLEGETLRGYLRRIWSVYKPLSPELDGGTSDGSTEAVSDQTQWDHDDALPDEVRATPQSHPREASTRPPAAAGHLREVLLIMRRVCATLAFLHGEGLLNCDLKPENVLLVGGNPVIIDFGLSLHHPGGQGREALEATQGIAGTWPYMSPEQIRGELLDARSDLYSLGCILFELVTGTPPFQGAPQEVARKQLLIAPHRPSDLVSNLPLEVERVMLRLLEKDLALRFGFADEVSAALAELCNDVYRLPEYPPNRSYLYRPRLAGRSDELQEIADLCAQAAEGAGVAIVVTGESGVGKTRFVMELARSSTGRRFRVITSECTALAAGGQQAVGSTPLQALRPLLTAISDRCQEGGPEVARRLLGPRGSTLALYEPLLSHSLAHDAAAPVSLPPDAAKRRLFRYLAESLSELAAEAPLMFVVDDLTWADELSLEFLQFLEAGQLSTLPLAIVATVRSDEVTPAVMAVTERPHVQRVNLSRLGPLSIRSIVSDMLALPEPDTDFVEFVAREAEGNPFFVAEYLRTAVSERVVYRDQLNSWRILGRSHLEQAGFESLPIPGSLRELIARRLQRLTDTGKQMVFTAAVLGREMELEVLLEVAPLQEPHSYAALDDLIRRQILEHASAERLRFVHDKLRELAYELLGPSRPQEVHARAAEVLERRFRDKPEFNRVWATLGHHYAEAGLPERAVHYLKLAAEQAKSRYAHDEAIQLYGAALQQIGQIVAAAPERSAHWQLVAGAVRESMADTMALQGQREAARTAYAEALSSVPDDDPLMAARILRKTGKTWETEHRHDEARDFYARALMALGDDPLSHSEPIVREWIETRIDELWVCYWLDRTPQMEALVEELKPIIESKASTAQRVKFFQSQLQLNLRRDRYLVHEETLGFARAAVHACHEAAEANELGMAQFNLGFALLFHGSLQAAVQELERARLLAERSGDLALQVRCLSYLAFSARRRDDPEACEANAGRALTLASACAMWDYVAAARAHQAWLALKRGAFDAASELAMAAIETWRGLALAFPLQWLALTPLLELALLDGRHEAAIELARGLVAPSQQSLPGAASDALSRACRRWDDGDHDAAQRLLALALLHLKNAGVY